MRSVKEGRRRTRSLHLFISWPATKQHNDFPQPAPNGWEMEIHRVHCASAFVPFTRNVARGLLLLHQCSGGTIIISVYVVQSRGWGGESGPAGRASRKFHGGNQTDWLLLTRMWIEICIDIHIVSIASNLPLLCSLKSIQEPTTASSNRTRNAPIVSSRGRGGGWRFLLLKGNLCRSQLQDELIKTLFGICLHEGNNKSPRIYREHMFI